MDAGRMFLRYKWHWLTGLGLFLLHTAIMYGVDVSTTNPLVFSLVLSSLLCQVPPAFGEPCGRGVLTPACNAATYIDKHIFTVAHM